MKTYSFTKRDDGSYRCESRTAGDGACLVRRNPRRRDEWETATIPAAPAEPAYSVTPVGDCFFTRQGAVMAHFFYFNTLR